MSQGAGTPSAGQLPCRRRRHTLPPAPPEPSPYCTLPCRPPVGRAGGGLCRLRQLPAPGRCGAREGTAAAAVHGGLCCPALNCASPAAAPRLLDTLRRPTRCCGEAASRTTASSVRCPQSCDCEVYSHVLRQCHRRCSAAAAPPLPLLLPLCTFQPAAPVSPHPSPLQC